ncbi:threonine dehydratase, putative [Ichthyophthirius multifiliis]|uniref:threonine ammonia-lyase n=1 Tax=Ichthyophthirius multifiliis TaxID=5932 RepID=G0QR53_ICHMU|nr:threonine dehydratase, putative [Ichthyophthirius multifiliis]EGR32305.1 threonine dehydratase, putative [Ichthyophthirius multifiliis]|eukprot:XP_004035791.1 threonine dehydratase, putative [Ichthyophthirius multifiliis]
MSQMSIIHNIHSKMKKESQIVQHTLLELSRKLSEKYEANIYLKREDNQHCRSFKIRGAFAYFSKLTEDQKSKDIDRHIYIFIYIILTYLYFIGIVTASDGNFALAVSYLCNQYKIKGYIFLPNVCQKQKIENIQQFGQEYVEIKLVNGGFYEDAVKYAKEFSQLNKISYLSSFDDQTMIDGNGTIALEVLQDLETDLDYCFVPVGGGGLAAGVSLVLSQLSPDTKCIGVEPDGASSMSKSLKEGQVVVLDSISRYCDGSSIRRVGDLPFKICKEKLSQVHVVQEGHISTTILFLYDIGIIAEPAGALSVAALDFFKDEIKGKNVVCILAGGNTELSRLDEFKEHSLLYEGLKYFFLINFPMRQGVLKEFIVKCLGPTDEICQLQFHKKPNRENGPALVTIEVRKKEEILKIQENMKKINLKYQIINEQRELYDLLF